MVCCYIVEDSISRLKARKEQVANGLKEVIASNKDHIIDRILGSQEDGGRLKAFHATVAATGNTVKTAF